MLTRQLQELKSDKLVHWEVCPAFPHKIAYSPTETDFSRVPIPVAMRDWDRFICKTKIQSHAALWWVPIPSPIQRKVRNYHEHQNYVRQHL